MKTIKDCEFTAFISYAHADDEAWFNWVTQFRNELERSLAALLRGVRLPRMHLSGENGPVAGALSDELKKRVAASFAMIIVVHDNYAQSTWCLRELEYFKTLFGEQGFRDRLYIVALSENAMLGVSGGSAWKQLLPDDDQVWMPFFEPSDRQRPLDIYMGPGLVSPAFRGPFERLRGDLAAKLKVAVADAARAAPPRPDGPEFFPAATPATEKPPEPQPAGQDDVAFLLSLPQQAAAGPAPAAPAHAGPPAGTAAFGFCPPAQAADVALLAQRLAQRGQPSRVLTQDAVFDEFHALDDASDLVLAFDETPLMLGSLAAGGHLQLQREAWLKRGKPAERLHWLDLRDKAGPPSAWQGAAAFVHTLQERVHTLQGLLDHLRPVVAPPASPQSVRIYIESNQHERNLWEPLGEQIRLKWDEVCQRLAPGRTPALHLRTRGLPVDQIDSFPSLDDADGVVLLWGRKTSDALVAQINKVENKLSPGRDVAPGIVAYLMPPQASTEPIPAWGWQVLRFDVHDTSKVDVVDAERDELDRFLCKVFERRQQRDKGLT